VGTQRSIPLDIAADIGTGPGEIFLGESPLGLVAGEKRISGVASHFPVLEAREGPTSSLFLLQHIQEAFEGINRQHVDINV
jgi:hypothetical protein